LSKTDVIEVEGVVTDSFPNAMFEVELVKYWRTFPVSLE